jgi:hypothetical protein
MDPGKVREPLTADAHPMIAASSVAAAAVHVIGLLLRDIVDSNCLEPGLLPAS